MTRHPGDPDPVATLACPIKHVSAYAIHGRCSACGLRLDAVAHGATRRGTSIAYGCGLLFGVLLGALFWMLLIVGTVRFARALGWL